MKPKRPVLSDRAAFALAAKLRRAGVPASGREVMTWSHYSTGAAELWLITEATYQNGQSFERFMGLDLPPPSHRSWSQCSARGRGVDGAGS